MFLNSDNVKNFLTVVVEMSSLSLFIDVLNIRSSASRTHLSKRLLAGVGHHPASVGVECRCGPPPK